MIVAGRVWSPNDTVQSYSVSAIPSVFKRLNWGERKTWKVKLEELSERWLVLAKMDLGNQKGRKMMRPSMGLQTSWVSHIFLLFTQADKSQSYWNLQNLFSPKASLTLSMTFHCHSSANDNALVITLLPIPSLQILSHLQKMRLFLIWPMPRWPVLRHPVWASNALQASLTFVPSNTERCFNSFQSLFSYLFFFGWTFTGRRLLVVFLSHLGWSTVSLHFTIWDEYSSHLFKICLVQRINLLTLPHTLVDHRPPLDQAQECKAEHCPPPQHPHNWLAAPTFTCQTTARQLAQLGRSRLQQRRARQRTLAEVSCSVGNFEQKPKTMKQHMQRENLCHSY